MKKLRPEDIQKRLPSFIKIDPKTYVSNKIKATFIDEDFGPWEALPCNVLRSKSPSRHPKRSKKQAKETNIKRYGCESPFSSQEIKEKIKATNLKKYGVEYPSQAKEVREKVKETMLSRYGVTHNRQIEGATEAFRETMRQKHGVNNPGQMTSTKMAVEADRQNNPEKYYHSAQEQEIRDFVTSLGFKTSIRYIRNKKRSFELDIYCEEKKIAIEFNGCYWHSEANKQMYPGYHLEKMKACEDQGIRLIQIFEHEWRDRHSQIESFLISVFGKNKIKIGARQIKIKEIPYQESKNFLNEYHIQGSAQGGLYLGCFFKDELVAVAVFGKHHRISDIEVLRRWCIKKNYNISGGLSKITKEGFRLLNTDMLVSWCDLRWSRGTGYLGAGWQVDAVIKPDYFYWDISKKRAISKQSRRKKAVNTPQGMTEHEHSKKDGLARIYDCGKIRFIFEISGWLSQD